VFVDDVAEAIARGALDEDASVGTFALAALLEAGSAST
jgi:hypothetical protein